MNVGDRVVFKTLDEYKETIGNRANDERIINLHKNMISDEMKYSENIFIIKKKLDNSLTGNTLCLINKEINPWENDIFIYIERLKKVEDKKEENEKEFCE